jgi:hypothetical protein
MAPIKILNRIHLRGLSAVGDWDPKHHPFLGPVGSTNSYTPKIGIRTLVQDYSKKAMNDRKTADGDKLAKLQRQAKTIAYLKKIKQNIQINRTSKYLLL